MSAQDFKKESLLWLQVFCRQEYWEDHVSFPFINQIFNSGVPHLQAMAGTSLGQELGLTAVGEFECNVLESSQNHPPPALSMEKSSSRKPVCGAKKKLDTADLTDARYSVL